MSFHGPKTLKGTVISYCDAQNKNYGSADNNAPWHNREYLVNGRLSETRTVIVLWQQYVKKSKQRHDPLMSQKELLRMEKDDEYEQSLSEHQGTYRIGHQGQFWLEVYQDKKSMVRRQTLSDDQILNLDSELVNNAKTIFRKMDKDNSGSIDYQEFGQVLIELGYKLSKFEKESLLQ